MALPWFLILNLIGSILFCVDVTHSSASDGRKAYVVYMGDKPESEVPGLHVNILREVVDNSNNDIAHEDLLLRSYKRSFHGFSAMLTEQEAQKLAEMDGVVSVFPSKKLSLKTTQSWNFVGLPETFERSQLESDIIIGVLDTGIWPEYENFNDDGLGPPPKKWKGICQGNNNFTCNNKIIGARYYKHDNIFEKGDIQSPRDSDGHGTHCASIAAGNMVSNASVNGLGLGTARGGLPSARIAVYKVSWSNGGAADVDILAACDDAIADGVDIITASMGGSTAYDYWMVGTSIGAFHATVNGILVSMAAGNSGPGKKTLGNIAPWEFSVASTTTSRKFVTKIQLGDGKVYESLIRDGINYLELKDKFYPLIYGGNASTGAGDSRSCLPGSLDENLIKGKIVLCDPGPQGTSSGNGPGKAVGAILTGKKVVDEIEGTPPSLASAHVSLEENSNIYNYIEKTRNPTATIWKSEEINDALAPYVPSYSSRGPNALNPNILKPDIAAPGTNILAAYAPDTKGGTYKFDTGTSMACPHVAGVAAYVKSFHLDWSPAAIRSAIITTATPMSVKTSPLAEFAYGAGLINPSRAPQPGLVYDLGGQDYIDFLCTHGYSESKLDLITKNETKTTPCSSRNVTANDLNYPSFALHVEDPEVVDGVFHRTVTNVGSPNSIYKAKVVTSSGLKIDVQPNVLSFTSLDEKKSFVVTIKGPIEQSAIVSASLVWDDGVFQVRSPIVVYI